jgi:hypothetical protein
VSAHPSGRVGRSSRQVGSTHNEKFALRKRCLENSLRVSENRVQRRIFGPKGEEVVGGWRKLYNEELHNLYCSPNIIRLISQGTWEWHGKWHVWGE